MLGTCLQDQSKLRALDPYATKPYIIIVSESFYGTCRPLNPKPYRTPEGTPTRTRNLSGDILVLQAPGLPDYKAPGLGRLPVLRFRVYLDLQEPTFLGFLLMTSSYKSLKEGARGASGF